MILFLSDFDQRGSGYMNIATNLCTELVLNHGRQVTALGVGYDGREHNHPFGLLPIPQTRWGAQIGLMLKNLRAMGDGGVIPKIEALVCAMDVPLHKRVYEAWHGTGQAKLPELPYVAIFPVESGPLTMSWAVDMSQWSERLVISQFGQNQLVEYGLTADYLPVGFDANLWRVPDPEERKKIREDMGYDEDTVVVLTVADNHERKNLSSGAEAMAILRDKYCEPEGKTLIWNLVTRIKSPIGWKLYDLSSQLDLLKVMATFDRGLPQEKLWTLYAAADIFMLPSKAEGLGMPILEAMSCGLPVVATNATAIVEHLWEDPDWKRQKEGHWLAGNPQGRRGWEVDPTFFHIDPFGNSVRSYISPEDMAFRIAGVLAENESEKRLILDRAERYARSRTWAKAGNLLDLAITKAIDRMAEQEAQRNPPSAPPSAENITPLPEVSYLETDQELSKDEQDKQSD